MQRYASELLNDNYPKDEVVQKLKQQFPTINPDQIMTIFSQIQQNASSLLLNSSNSLSQSFNSSQLSQIRQTPNEEENQQPKLKSIKKVPLPKNPITNYLIKPGQSQSISTVTNPQDQLKMIKQQQQELEKLKISINHLREENSVLIQKQQYNTMSSQRKSLLNRCKMALNLYYEEKTAVISKFKQSMEFQQTQASDAVNANCFERQITNQIMKLNDQIQSNNQSQNDKNSDKYQLILSNYKLNQQINQLNTNLNNSFQLYRENCNTVKLYKQYEISNHYKGYELPTWYPIQELQQQTRLRPQDLVLPQNIPKFILLTQIGKGGFSQVFKAFDIELSEFVAVKISEYQVQDISEEQIQKRWKLLQREAIINQEVVHQNLIQLINKPIRINSKGNEVQQENTGSTTITNGVATVNNVVQNQQQKVIEIALEQQLCDEENLNDYIYRLSQYRFFMNPQELEFQSLWLLSGLLQVFDGLKYLHNKKIIHNDISLQNILRKDNTFLLADFGFAKIVQDLKKSQQTNVTTLGGTLIYQSPERLIYGKMNYQSDIYSMGVLMAIAFLGNQKMFVSQYQLYLRYKQNNNSNNSNNLNNNNNSENINQEIENQYNCSPRIEEMLKQQQNLLLPLPKEIEELILEMLQFDWQKRPKANQCYDRLEKCIKKLIKKYKM